jgi:hypothetical protein
MKIKTLFYILVIFGLLLIPSLAWAIINPSWWSILVLLALSFITGWIGIEYAYKAKKIGVEGIIDEFLNK